MKRTIINYIVLAAFLFTACQKEHELNSNGFGKDIEVFSATTESSSSKTTLNKNAGNYDVLWQNGDQITIEDGASTPNVGVYTTTATTTHADFSFSTGAVATTPNYKAYYPSTLYNSGEPFLPSTQNYIEGNICGAPMYAQSSTASLAFKNICGIIRLNVTTTQESKKVRRIILASAKGLSGVISNTGTLVTDGYAATVSGTANLTLDCGESGVSIGTTPVPFYFSVPEGAYTPLTIAIEATDGTWQARTSNYEIAVNRSQITDISLGFNSFETIFTANASTIAAEMTDYNASASTNPLLRITEDISSNITVTRANGVIDLGGNTTGNWFLQNNILGNTLIIRNGTMGDVDGKGGHGTFYYGTVILENVNTNIIWNDGHEYIIKGGTHKLIELECGASTPGTVIIYDGRFDNIYRYHDKYGGGDDGSKFILYGGKYKTSPETKWLALGYTIKSNTDSDKTTYPYVVALP